MQLAFDQIKNDRCAIHSRRNNSGPRAVVAAQCPSYWQLPYVTQECLQICPKTFEQFSWPLVGDSTLVSCADSARPTYATFLADHAYDTHQWHALAHCATPLFSEWWSYATLKRMIHVRFPGQAVFLNGPVCFR